MSYFLLGRPNYAGERSLLLTLDEREQILIRLVFECRAHAVRRALVDLELCVLDDFGRQHGRRADRHDLVIVPVHDQRSLPLHGWLDRR
jgi:hypothetical protein